MTKTRDTIVRRVRPLLAVRVARCAGQPFDPPRACSPKPSSPSHLLPPPQPSPARSAREGECSFPRLRGKSLPPARTGVRMGANTATHFNSSTNQRFWPRAMVLHQPARRSSATARSVAHRARLLSRRCPAINSCWSSLSIYRKSRAATCLTAWSTHRPGPCR